MSMRRSIAVLKNDRKFARVFLFLHKEIDAFLFSGPEQFFNIFQRRASHPLPLREPRFFNADSIDVDASIDRGADPFAFRASSLPSPALRSPCLFRLQLLLSAFFSLSLSFFLFLFFLFSVAFLGTSLKAR